MIKSGGRKSAVVVIAITLATTDFPAAQGGKGQGAIVIRNDAPVYKKSKGEKIVETLKRGDAVAGWTMTSFGDQVTQMMDPGSHVGPSSGEKWIFDEKDGRVMVVYSVPAKEGRKQHRAGGWMDPADLSRFTYEGSCTPGGSPFLTDYTDPRLNACFQEARDNKLDQLRVLWSEEDAAKAGEAGERKE